MDPQKIEEKPSEVATWKRRSVRALTPEVAEQIVASIHACNTLTDAAQAAGVALPTLENWLAKGRKARTGVYHDFALTVGIAQVEAKERLVTILGQAAESDPRWAAWLLSKKWPREYGDRVQHVVESEMNALLDVAQSVLPQEYYVLLLSELTARSGGGATSSQDVSPRLVGGGVSNPP